MQDKPAKIASYDLSNSEQTINLATDLANFIKERKLSVNLQGKEYILCEGYQYAGSRLGILPVVESLTNRSTPDEVKYESQVHLLNLRTGQIVGRGFALCSQKEPGKKFFQEYAIASMAQTRAVGKAYRMILGWLIKAAGYEPCSFEEMEPVHQAQNTAKAEAITSKHVESDTPRLERPVPPEISAKAETLNATTKQKAELLLLLNSEVITKEEKEKSILSINKLSPERADKMIANLKNVIADRRSSMPEQAEEDYINELEGEHNES